ncbi:MAG: hypothetical protein WBX01_13590 [Nitrososphaeraceae archaeon]
MDGIIKVTFIALKNHVEKVVAFGRKKDELNHWKYWRTTKIIKNM